ncbi:uncharacterized protein METZ01_LOCUS157231 [marine metagenome]|uniref:Uncharacterized protein n=1 Tax=marine metagenome TaxID=408172 RepID=A0A382ATU7_9ZZZZ
MMLSFLITSCESLREGLTGSKNLSTDEFLVEKKDPLVLPPDFENLPNPSERQVSVEEMTSFEKTLKKQTISESSSATENSVEESILNQIKKR